MKKTIKKSDVYHRNADEFLHFRVDTMRKKKFCEEAKKKGLTRTGFMKRIIDDL